MRLQQHGNEFLQLLSFFSRKLTPTQTKYSAYDRELLAIYAAIKHFRYILEGNFHVITDYKPLVYAFKRKSDQRQTSQLYVAKTIYLFFISEFTIDVRHVSDAENIVADALSCVTIVKPITDMQKIAEAQASDNELQQSYINIFEAQKIYLIGNSTQHLL